MRRGTWLLVVLASLLAVSPANAALKKYRLNNTALTNQSDQDEQDFVHFAPHPNQPQAGPGTVLIDEGVPGSPKLRKLVDPGDVTVTIPVPSLTTSIFLSNNDRSGPGVTFHIHGNGDQAPVFTGTGNTANGSTIRWGTVTGWSNSGSQWCHSIPAVICTLADRMDQATTDPPIESEFYDLGTWFFHGTGFTSVPFLEQYFSTSFGNNQFTFRAPVVNDTMVPAMEILGIGILGLSLVTGGAIAIRRGGNKP